MTTELLDQIIARLPALRDQGVTHISVDPASGAVSMLIAPKPPEMPEGAPEGKPFDDGSTYSLPPGTPMPRSFRERLNTARGGGGAPEVK
jgi:hypothetical protein